MRSINFHDPIIWTFLPTQVTLDLARGIHHRLLVYYCMDRFSATSREARKVLRTEAEVIRSADLVFAMSHKLVEFCRQFRKDVVHVPMGVNSMLFEQRRSSSGFRPADIADLDTPIIGYIGGVRKSIDKVLVKRIAEEMPDCSLVFVGPIQTAIEDLSRYSNVRFVGRKEHAEIPEYVRSFDCCILPYVVDSYTDSVSPAKLHEYLIMGKPVVSTAIAEVVKYADRYSDGQREKVIYVARSPEEFIDQLRIALTEEGTQAPARIALAREHSWPEKTDMMSSLISAKLQTKGVDSSRDWQDRLRRYYRQARAREFRIAAGAAALALIYFLLFYTPVVWGIASPLKIAQSPLPADAIVVFAGGVGESGEAGRGYEERVAYAVQLYKEGYAHNLVFSSGFVYALKEPQLMRALAVSLGVPNDAIVLETNAHSTYLNVYNVYQILVQRGWQQILLVSSPYHMRRALLTWQKVAPQVKVIPAPIPYSRFYAHQVGASLEQIRAILHEYAAIIVYWWRGWI